MRTGILFCAVLLIALAVVGQTQADPVCDGGNEECAMRCFNNYGSVGECDGYGSCNCNHGCIYRGCRKVCRKQGKIAQCQENECVCLS